MFQTRVINCLFNNFNRCKCVPIIFIVDVLYLTGFIVSSPSSLLFLQVRGSCRGKMRTGNCSMVLRGNGIPCTGTRIYWPKNNRKWKRFLLTIRQRGVKVKNTVSFMYRLKGQCHFSRILYFFILLAFYEVLTDSVWLTDINCIILRDV